MGNACACDNNELDYNKENNFTTQSVENEANIKKSLNRRKLSDPTKLYNGDYDPIKVIHDPDIRCKDPFDYTREDSVFRPGTTKKVGMRDLNYKAENGCELETYLHSYPVNVRTDNKHEPIKEVAVVGVMNIISPTAKKHLNQLGEFLYGNEPATADNVELGPYRYTNGSTYKGQYKLGQRSGFGTEITPKGDVYVGQWLKDTKFGKGRLILSNGNMYEGEWLNNNAHGNGTYISDFEDNVRSKIIYVGEFRNNKQNGKGKQSVSQDNSCYTGDFADNAKHGKGELVFKDQSKYVGEFKDDIASGLGKYYYPDGRVYEGDFKNNMKHGYGSYSMGNGMNYVGDFVEGRREGQGRLTWSDGRIYKGGFLKSLQHGEGEYFSTRKEWKKGIWQLGERLRWL